MENNLIRVKTFGSLEPTTLYRKDVSLSFDTINYSQNSEIKVLVQIEPPEILDIRSAIINNSDKFDLILAWDTEILKSCKNSKKFVFGTCWIDFNNLNLEKKNEVSFIMSNKRMTPDHLFRHSVWEYLNKFNEINGFYIKKFMTPPRIGSKNQLFENAKFHIVIENARRENWITEKIIDCFATKTIPIYHGCPNIGEYFNEKGIIKFNNLQELDEILNNITPQIYNEMYEYIEENFVKSYEYFDFHKRVENEINNIIDNLV
jgi:hypothetical protein